MKEASRIDPQMRLLLMCTWECLERAGIDASKLRSTATGVFLGAQTLESANWRPLGGGNEHSIAGSSVAMVANRVSYHYNLMGPSVGR
eukprot:1190561-Prorocentrum_minimum.AAC.6